MSQSQEGNWYLSEGRFRREGYRNEQNYYKGANPFISIWNEYDNNISDHFHIFDEEKNQLIDIPHSAVKFSKLPTLPKNKKIKNISLIINLENK